MHDSVGLQLGTSLQSAKLQLANLLQNCYFCLIQETISNSILWSLVIKYFWPGCFAPPYLLRPGATAPLCPPSVTPLRRAQRCGRLYQHPSYGTAPLTDSRSDGMLPTREQTNLVRISIRFPVVTNHFEF